MCIIGLKLQSTRYIEPSMIFIYVFFILFLMCTSCMDLFVCHVLFGPVITVGVVGMFTCQFSFFVTIVNIVSKSVCM